MLIFGAAVIIAAAAIPCIIFVALMDRFDRFKKEPRILLFKLLGAGMVSAVAAIVIEIPIGWILVWLPEDIYPAANALFGASIPEETVKLAALWLVVRSRHEFDELLDGAVYGVTAAMGFALLENLLYVIGSGDVMTTSIIRGLTAVPLHALAGGIMGLAVARWRIESSGSVGIGFLAAVVIHALYDWFLMDPRVPGWPIAPLLILGWILLTILIRRARRKDILAGRHAPDPGVF